MPSCGLRSAPQENPSRPQTVPQERSLLQLRDQFYDESSYPNDEYFWKLVARHDGSRKDAEIAWHLKNSWKN